ncbi:MAG: dipeptidase [Candidatus Dormibacteraeota bacterium]|nr:dipeptidase [Candidatus Dormibacteraeota bacterium]
MSWQDHTGSARQLLARAPLVDGHNDLAWAVRVAAGYDLDRLDVGTRQTSTHTDLARLREGGVAAQFWSVFVPSTMSGDAAVAATLEQIDFVYAMAARYPDRLSMAFSAADVDAAFARGTIASLLGAEGGHSIACSMGTLRMLHALGVRYLTLTHNYNVPWADSATDQRVVGGLSAFGRDVVREMNRLGMLVDLSHVSAETVGDALETSETPVIFSHSSCRHLVDHPRNVPDVILRQLATNGGVCMVTFVPDFVSAECAAWSAEVTNEMIERGLDSRDLDARRAFGTEYATKRARPPASAEQVVDHIEHVRDVAGIDHVGIGGDYDGCDDLPIGLGDVAQYPRIFAELLERGWSELECSQLAGRNVLRVLRDAELTAARLQRTRDPSLATIDSHRN